MALKFSQAIPAKALKELADGDIFLVLRGEGYLVCMKGEVAQQGVIIVLGCVNAEWGSEGAGWFFAHAHDGSPVYLLEDVTIDFLASPPTNLPLPGKAANGAFLADEAGTFWFYTKDKQGADKFNAQTGQPGEPKGRTYYNNWQILWAKPGDEKPTVVFTNKVT